MSEVNADGVLLNPHEAILQEVQALSNALMALPNLAALLMLAPEALSTLRQWTELRHANLTSILPFHQRKPHHDML